VLRDLGARPEERVAVLLERGPDQIAAWLGVLKSGAAAVPIDPAYPEERRRQLVEDSGAVVVIGDGGPHPPGGDRGWRPSPEGAA
jgi:myxalamid-type nonribosomal peptide synthetase MxaA